MYTRSAYRYWVLLAVYIAIIIFTSRMAVDLIVVFAAAFGHSYPSNYPIVTDPLVTYNTIILSTPSVMKLRSSLDLDTLVVSWQRYYNVGQFDSSYLSHSACGNIALHH